MGNFFAFFFFDPTQFGSRQHVVVSPVVFIYIHFSPLSRYSSAVFVLYSVPSETFAIHTKQHHSACYLLLCQLSVVTPTSILDPCLLSCRLNTRLVSHLRKSKVCFCSVFFLIIKSCHLHVNVDHTHVRLHVRQHLHCMYSFCIALLYVCCLLESGRVTVTVTVTDDDSVTVTVTIQPMYLSLPLSVSIHTHLSLPVCVCVSLSLFLFLSLSLSLS
jgi:hypothetical protein